MLLSGAIEAGDLKGAVRIKNLSETGALLEGAALPRVGEHLTLRRLDLEIGGVVVWQANARCGVRFEGSISVAGWRRGTWIPQLATSDQARVDQIQASVRAGQVVSPAANTLKSDPATLGTSSNITIARELTALQKLLDDMGEQLSDDVAVLKTHGVTLQKFDVASQILGHLANVLSSGDRSSAIDAIGMNELRSRLLES